jgi:membrane-bound lytic murein transglycosylase D
MEERIPMTIRINRLLVAVLACGTAGAWAQGGAPAMRAEPAVPAASAVSGTSLAPLAVVPAPPAASAASAASAPSGGPLPAASGAPSAAPTPDAAASTPLSGAAPAPAASAAPAAMDAVPALPQAASPAASAASSSESRPAGQPANPTAPANGDAPPIVGTEVAPPVETVLDAPTLREDLWGRVRRGYAIPELSNDLVRKWEQYYTTRPDYLSRMFDRGGRYLYHIVEEVSKRGMPTELALLPFVESAFNPHAQSSARASGIWQFMPATGRHFALRQNLFRDDRRSVLDSTRAALDYLEQLHRMFGDWKLALAAYNWGQGNVSRALSANRAAGRGQAYTELSMPDETRNYVPKLQAIANIVGRPESFGVDIPALQNHPYFLTVRVDRDIDVALAARLAGLSLEEFQALNPQMNKPVILAAGTPQVLLPFDNAHRYQREVAQHRGPFASWTAWIAPRTVKPAEAARSVGMSEQQLREINRIPPRMLVKAGSTLLVPRGAHAQRDVSEHVADNASIALAPEPVPGRKRLVKAGPRGETVAALARRYKVSAANLARWNGVSTAGSFRPGQQVVLMLAPQKTVARGRAAAVARSAKSGQRSVVRAPVKGKAATAARPPVRVAKR